MGDQAVRFISEAETPADCRLGLRNVDRRRNATNLQLHRVREAFLHSIRSVCGEGRVFFRDLLTRLARIALAESPTISPRAWHDRVFIASRDAASTRGTLVCLRMQPGALARFARIGGDDLETGMARRDVAHHRADWRLRFVHHELRQLGL